MAITTESSSMFRPKIKCLNLQLKFNYPEVSGSHFSWYFLVFRHPRELVSVSVSECRECREGAPLLLRVSVSVCCKKVGGRIHQRYKDRCYSGSWSSRHTGIDIETEEVISVKEFNGSLGVWRHWRAPTLGLWSHLTESAPIPCSEMVDGKNNDVKNITE